MAGNGKEHKIGLVISSVSAILVMIGGWQLDNYSQKERIREAERKKSMATINALIDELKSEKASIMYVDKENDKQDARTEKRFDKIDGKLDYIIDRIDRISTGTR